MSTPGGPAMRTTRSAFCSPPLPPKLPLPPPPKAGRPAGWPKPLPLGPPPPPATVGPPGFSQDLTHLATSRLVASSLSRLVKECGAYLFTHSSPPPPLLPGPSPSSAPAAAAGLILPPDSCVCVWVGD